MKFTSIADYNNSLDENGKAAVHELNCFMSVEFPGITPKICFAMLMWWAGTKMYDGYIAISAAKKHFSIHFHDARCLYMLQRDLPGRKFGQKCVNIAYGDDQALEAVKRTIKACFFCKR